LLTIRTRFLSKNLKIKYNKTVILPVVLYECELGLSLRDEHIFKVSENKELRRIMGLMREEGKVKVKLSLCFFFN
jgi:hypothetical protein